MAILTSICINIVQAQTRDTNHVEHRADKQTSAEPHPKTGPLVALKAYPHSYDK
jgi:hypothetical protein